jgi:hypothetical protein
MLLTLCCFAAAAAAAAAATAAVCVPAVGSGCYDANTGMRYRDGESTVLPGNVWRRCNYGNWE